MGQKREDGLITIKALRHALDNIRLGRPLGETPLKKLVCVQHRMGISGQPVFDYNFEVQLFGLLVELIVNNLKHVRQIEGNTEGIPTSRDEALFQLQQDFQSSNDGLQEWSILAFRYAFVDFGFQIADLVASASMTERTLNRRINLGCLKLLQELMKLEAAAKETQHKTYLYLRMPPAPYSFVMGFDALEETIFQSINQYQGPVILKGPAGAGKSSLAHSVVEALIKQNPPDELLWITLDYPTPYGGLLALTAGRAGLTLPPDEPVEEKELLLAYYLNRQKTLLVIDQAEHLEDMEATLTRFHQVAQGIQLIVVTRIWPINELPAQIYVVPSLTQEESIKLARRYIRQKRFPVLDDGQIEKMAILGNGNPRLLLAIVEQSSYLPVSIIEERLSSSSDPERQLLHLHQATWDMLEGLSKRLLFQLVLTGSDMPLTWAEIDMGWNKAANDLQRALQQLVEVSWLNFDPLAQRYTLPPLVKNYVLLQAEQPDNNALIGDILTGRQEPLTNSDDWAADQLQTFGVMARHVDDPGRLKALIAARAANIHRTGNWVGWRGVLLDILNRLDELDDKLPLAYIYREIGISARWLGELQEAEKALEKAVVLFGELEDFIAQGGVLIENGQLYQLQGQTLKAFDLYRWVKEMGDLYGEPALYVRAMRGLIELALSNKQTQAAIELANELVSSPFHGEMDGMLNSTLGMVMLQEGRLQQAQEYHQIAVEWFLDQDDFPNLARALMRKGMASHAAGSREAATEDLQVALNMMRFMRDAYGEARALTNLGSIYAGHNSEEAKKCWTDGLQLQIRLGDTIGAIYSRYNLLDMFWEDMNPDDACREFRELSFLATQYQQVFVIDALRSHPLAGDPRCS